jgi:cytochrome c
MKEPNLEWNKVFAACLTAGIIAMLAGFFADKLVKPHVPEKAVLDIDTSALETAGSGAAAGPTGPEPILALLAGADVKRGEQLSKACTACHSFDKGGADRVGPNQWNLVGAAKAHREGFAYSDALKALHSKGEKWTYAELNHFIWKPQAAVPGTKMNYLGLKKPEDRAALIAYLRTLSDSPAPLPSNEEIQAEAAASQAAAPKDVPATAPADAKQAVPAATGSDKPAENSAPDSAPVKQGESNVPATEHAVPPSASE